MTDLVAVKCEQKECGLKAAASMSWPGRAPLLLCVEHGREMRAAAGAMGFTLVIERLVNEPPVGASGRQ
jgi:hypothetical protein